MKATPVIEGMTEREVQAWLRPNYAHQLCEQIKRKYMSASIFWRPVDKKHNHLSTAAPQAFMESLEAIGWSRGGELNADHLPALKGIVNVLKTRDNDTRGYEQLIEAIERHDEIVVWPEY